MSKTVLEFRNVWKKFTKGEKATSIRDAIPMFFSNALKKQDEALKKKEFWALQDVDFEMKKGDILGLVGPNGAGKSTALKLLSRILVPTKGKVTVRGTLSALIEVTAGFHPELTGRENLYLNASILGMRKREIDKKYDTIVEFSGLEEFMDTPVKRFSTGMSSRLGFSVAAHMNPDILLVDEVLSVGDMSFQAKCSEKIRQLLQSGTTIIMVSHNLQLIQKLCSRAILIDHGKMIHQGSPQEIVPYYENYVYKAIEAAIMKKQESLAKESRVEQEAGIIIKDVAFYDSANQAGSAFTHGSSFVIAVDYEASKEITQPIVSLDIVRDDGVYCCCVNTKDAGVSVDYMNGAGRVMIGIKENVFSPGVYLIKISIWDKDMIHVYAVRRRDVFRIEQGKGAIASGGVFVPTITWHVKSG